MNFLVSVLILPLLTFSVQAISCFNCTSNDLIPDKSCVGANISSKHLIQCPQPKKYCMVQRTTATVLRLRTTQTTRQCSDAYIHRCIHQRGVDSCFDTCTEDACNKDASVSSSKLLMIATLTILWITVSR